jgi:hypothetical protein
MVLKKLAPKTQNFKEIKMNNLNNKSNQTASTLDTTKVQTRGGKIQVKLGQKMAAAAKLSSRPSRSLFRAKSLMKPGVVAQKKTQQSRNA